MKKFSFFLLCSTLLFTLSAQAATTRLSIGTAGTAGVLYPFGVALGQTISKYVPELMVTGEATAGSVENIRNLNSGVTAFAFSQNQNAAQAYLGIGPYKDKPAPDLQSIMATIVSYLHIFVPQDSPIQNIQDLKGKRVSVGAAGSGGEMDTRLLLNFYNITYKDIKPQFIPETEAILAIKDRRIDAIICTHPLQSAAMNELTLSMPLRLIPINDENFYSQFPYFAKGNIPANTYKNINSDTVTPRITNVLFTSSKANLPDDLIYQITKAIWEHADEWKHVHHTVEERVSLENALEGLTIPLAPGAEKYYKEKGLLE